MYLKSKQSLCRPGQALRIPGLPEVVGEQHVKVVSLSALRTGRLYAPGNLPGTHFCYRLSLPQVHSATGRITSM